MATFRNYDYPLATGKNPIPNVIFGYYVDENGKKYAAKRCTIRGYLDIRRLIDCPSDNCESFKYLYDKAMRARDIE